MGLLDTAGVFVLQCGARWEIMGESGLWTPALWGQNVISWSVHAFNR
jgi:hypothetical protein